MEDNKDLVEETEKVEEQTTEEIVEAEEPKQEKTFTEKELDEIVAKKLARKEEKVRREFEKKYGRLETVVNAGLGTTNTEEAVEQLTDFYEKKGVQIPQESYSSRDLEVLAEAEANEIISDGYDEIVSEVDRLAAEKDNLSQRDKLVFKKLANERKKLEEMRDLAAIGVQELDDDFRAYEAKLNPNYNYHRLAELYIEVLKCFKFNLVEENIKYTR